MSKKCQKLVWGYLFLWGQPPQWLMWSLGLSSLIPEPFVLQDHYVNHEINGWTRKPKELPKTYSDLHANILDEPRGHKLKLHRLLIGQEPGPVPDEESQE